MEKVFNQNGLVLYKDNDTIVGNLSKEEALSVLEEVGVKALSRGDFDSTLRTATIAARVHKSYEQRVPEENSGEDDPVEEDAVLQSLLDIIIGAYEEDHLDELICMMAMTHLHTKSPIIKLVKEFNNFCK
jgi:hypothetical protein